MRSISIWLTIALLVLGLILGVGYLLVSNGVFGLTNPRKVDFPIHGIDVSHHQGEIDWRAIAQSDYSFAIIKATEGGDHRDSKFIENWKAAKDNKVVVGAYHYYSFCKSPEVQFINFSNFVPRSSGVLPPAIDLEYDNNCNGSIDVKKFRVDLLLFIHKVEQFYGAKPILYCNEDFYNKYLNIPSFKGCQFWIRNVFKTPYIGGDVFEFWQFSSKGKVPGIKGFVDKNVYYGSRENFEKLLIP